MDCVIDFTEDKTNPQTIEEQQRNPKGVDRNFKLEDWITKQEEQMVEQEDFGSLKFIKEVTKIESMDVDPILLHWLNQFYQT